MKLRSGRQTGVLVNQKCSKPSYRCSPALLVISVYISTILICVVNSKNICVDDVKDYVLVSWDNIQENWSIIRANIGNKKIRIDKANIISIILFIVLYGICNQN